MPITTKPSIFSGHQYITRKVMTAFMDWLGQNLFIERFDENGAVYRYIQVPVQFATRERFMTVIKAVNQKTAYGGDQTLKLDFNRILPRISVSIINYTYDAERHVSKFQKVRQTVAGSDGDLGTIPVPVPYTLEVEMSIITKMTDDTYQIMEQLLPYFGPTFNLDVNFLAGYESKSVGFSLTSIIPEAIEELGIDEERVSIMTYNFSVKLEYPFIRTDRATIKEMLLNYNVGSGIDDVDLGNDDFIRFKQYQMTADNLTPVTTIDERENEPITITISERAFSTDFALDFF